MNHIEKFIARLNPQDSARVFKAIEALRKGIKSGERLEGSKQWLKFRIGKIRIVYSGSKENFKVHTVDWRDKVYKNL